MSKSADFFLDMPAGQAVFSEGDKGQTMYIIESGVVEIFLAARGKDVVARLGPGDFFGEMEMLGDQPRFASAVAREPVRLLKIERTDLAELLRQNVEIAICIMRKLAARQRTCEVLLSETLAENARLRRKPSPASAPAKVATVEVPPMVPASARDAVKPAAERSSKPEPALPAAKSRGGCVLRHAQGDSFPLDPAGTVFLVGRPDQAAGINPEINLSGVDPTRSLSRRHAKLVRQGQLYFVREEAATVNGTFVNNIRVTTGVDVPIKPGDKLRFGAVEVDFAAV